MNRIRVCGLVYFGLLSGAFAVSDQPVYVRTSGPQVLSFPELVLLGEQDKISSELQKKLTALLTTPFVSNEAFYRRAKPHRPALTVGGPGLRLLQWNIERGVELDNIKLAFADSNAFLAKVNSSPL